MLKLLIIKEEVEIFYLFFEFEENFKIEENFEFEESWRKFEVNQNSSLWSGHFGDGAKNDLKTVALYPNSRLLLKYIGHFLPRPQNDLTTHPNRKNLKNSV